MFEISNEALKGALDRFANVFTAPLFDESCVQKEIQAVNSENDNYINNDTWRYYHLLKQTCKKGHPYNKFGIGDKETLGGTPGVRDDLLKFHEKYYSANIMTLVILSKYPIETMTNWATKFFSDIPNKNIESPNVGSNPFTKEELGFHFNVLRKQESDYLQCFWPLNSLQKHYRDNPINVLSHLLGHEGNNSLFVVLKEEGLIHELISGGWDEFKVLTNFMIKMKLTEKGFEE